MGESHRVVDTERLADEGRAARGGRDIRERKESHDIDANRY
jgi:hypothetical protein